MMESQKQIEQLIQAFENPLPGWEGQKRMAPLDRLEGLRNYKKARKSAVLIFCYPKEDRLCFSLMKRSDYQGDHSGEMSLPGGKHEGDETLMQTALREMKEELGVNLSEDDVIGELTELYIPPSKFLVYPFLAYLNYEPQFVADKKEVKKRVEVPLSLLLDDSTAKREQVDMSTVKLLAVPYFDIYGYKVWGATAMILSELKELMKKLAIQ